MGEETVFETLPPLAEGEAGTEKPCGCHDKAGAGSGEPFAASEPAPAAAGLIAELDAALAGVVSGTDAQGGLDLFAIEEQLELAASGGETLITLEDLIAFAERNPGLKITFSF
ncbi:MAG TPA: hypothetical protein VFS10_04010 [Pyrinomonadaceae bacterium]|nr:hypothetical protein [Pyrinomonadaceae bacterium]